MRSIATKIAVVFVLVMSFASASLAAQHSLRNRRQQALTLSVSPSTVTLSATQGSNPPSAAVDVTSSGSGTLKFTASSDASWLTVTPASHTGSATLQLTFALSSASPGTYVGHVTVTAPGAQHSPAKVTVTADVSASAAPPSTYSISGTITPPPSGSTGYTVTVTPNNVAATTNASGQYSLSNLSAGTYTVTPSASGYTFTPPNKSVTIGTSNVSGVNFTAAASTSSNEIFYDDFTAASLTSDWYAMNKFGDTSNNEVQCYTPAQDQLSGGYLVITSAAQSVTCGQNGSSKSSYNSGMVTWSTFNFTYGTVEFRAKMTGGQGPWPSIWLLGYHCEPSNAFWSASQGNCNWPAPGSDEIDITEILNSDHTAVNQQLHSNGHNDGCTATTSDVSQNFHVYQLIWSAGSMVWKIDGTTTCTIKQSYVPNTPMFMVIDTAMGSYGGSISNSTLPQTMQVDYVKVTQP